MPAWLETSHLRVDVAGTPAIDGLTLASTGDLVLVLGGPRALFEAAAGLRVAIRGELRVAGVTPHEAVRGRLAAAAPLDPPLPAAWRARAYVRWSARLAGHPRATAAALAEEAIERLQLAPYAAQRLGALPSGPRRAVTIAAALATGADLLLLEDPLSGLPDEASLALGRSIARALADRRGIVFTARMPLESPIGVRADEAILIDRAQVVAQGAPAELAARERTYLVTVFGELEAFLRGVRDGGGRAEVASTGAPAARVRVDLGPLATRDLLRIAAAANSVVVGLRALSLPFI